MALLFQHSWAQLGRAVQQMVHACVVENVTQLPEDLVREVYGPSFEWARTVLCPADVGFHCISRDRTLY